MKTLAKNLVDKYLDWKSFKTENPVLIIESDDWGSLRTKDRQCKEKLNKISPLISKDRYVQLDSIATKEDLENLFDVLHSVKDRNGKPACITANVCTANPDFKKIKGSKFENFYYNSFTETLEEYSKDKSLLSIWKEGQNEGVFMPQLHGREHVHALAWLEELKEGNEELLKAFDLQSWGIPYTAIKQQRRANLQASLDIYGLEGEKEFQAKWLRDSVKIFDKAFGFKASSFIAPTYVWHSRIYEELEEIGILSLQGIKLQYMPSRKNGDLYNRIPHYTGQLSKKNNIRFTCRNAFFEPFSKAYKNISSEDDMVKITLSAVDKAIKLKKPAIIGTHRVNFIGRLSEKNRDNNLKALRSILREIVEKYPNVEFLHSGELSKKMKNDTP